MRQVLINYTAYLLQVYNITPHIINHPGWECGCGTSTVLAIMNALGTDCRCVCPLVASPYAQEGLIDYSEDGALLLACDGVLTDFFASSEEFEELHSPDTKAQMTYYCIGTVKSDEK